MRELKIFFNASIRYKAWGGVNHFLINLIESLKEKGHKITFKLQKDIDLIFIVWNMTYQSKKHIDQIFKFKKKYPSTKILHRINDCDKRKNTTNVDSLILKLNKICDETVFISNWLANYFKEQGFNRQYHVIYNGCNPKYFLPKEREEIGDKVKLVTHHFSNNWLKGFDIYIELDKVLAKMDNISFSYIGNYYGEYTPKNTKILPPLYGKELGDELRTYDIYLTASRWEPCGMHHIEGARCGLPVLYHQEGGGIIEICKNYGVQYDDINSLLKGVDEIKRNYLDYRNHILYDFLSSERANEQYYQIISKMFE